VRMAISLFLCSLAGFAFAKYEFRFKSPLFMIIIASMMIPWQAILVPLYVLMVRIGWVNSYLALWVPWMATAFGIFLMRQYMLSLPDELLDAGRIDGAGEFRLYWQIALPLATPALSAFGIILFLQQWTNFLWPLIILNTENKFTLPIGLAALVSQLSNFRVEWGAIMVAATLTTLPILIVFLLLQRAFISGLTLGSVKG
jgi:ABC-type glycerol-3-phosphate transport system permease component